jgi:hypothetical protein
MLAVDGPGRIRGLQLIFARANAAYPLQVDPRSPNPPPQTSGDMTWTFEVVPNTNMQSLRPTIRSSHPWLTMETTGSTALSPSNAPPTQISTHGGSPRLAGAEAHSEASGMLR